MFTAPRKESFLSVMLVFYMQGFWFGKKHPNSQSPFTSNPPKSCSLDLFCLTANVLVAFTFCLSYSCRSLGS